MAKVGRKRKAVGWSTLLKLGLTVNFDKNPAAHTFLFENIENEGLSEFIVGLIETHLVANCPHYMDSEYQFKVIKVAREAEEEMLRQKLNARQAEDYSSIKGGVPLMSNASLARTDGELTFSLVSGGIEGGGTYSGQPPEQVRSLVPEQDHSQFHRQVQNPVQSRVQEPVLSQAPSQVRDSSDSPVNAGRGAPNPEGGKTPAGLSEEERESNENIANDLINN